MSQVTRYHEGGILVPLNLLDSISSALAVDADCHESIGMYVEEALDLERLCNVPRINDPVLTDASVLSRARNVLDGYLIDGGCEAPVEVKMGECCCVWCQVLLLRDWCDAVLDRAGFISHNAWIGVTPENYHPDIELAQMFQTARYPE